MMGLAVKDVERKVTKIGNSLGTTLPTKVLEHIGVQLGDEIKFNLEDNGRVSISRSKRIRDIGVLEDNFDQDFLDGLSDLFHNYDNTLRNLSDR